MFLTHIISSQKCEIKWYSKYNYIDKINIYSATMNINVRKVNKISIDL